MHPFDIRPVLLAKHAQHVVLIHFPIALFIAAVAFDFSAQWTKNRTLAAAAYFNLLLATVLRCRSWRRACSVAVGAGRAKAKRDSVNAPDSGLHIECAHLVCVLGTSVCATPSRTILAKIPAAGRSGRGVACGVDRAPWRVS